MKVGIIGLGSMGKRRIRNLQALGLSDLVGFDLREDRRLEAQNRYKIPVVSQLSGLAAAGALVISTPPDHHTEYLEWCLDEGKPCFVELNVVLQDLARIKEKAAQKGILIAPSWTFLFHPAIEYLRTLVSSKIYGKVTNFTYHSGHYLPDWHPWESVKDFFVSNAATSGCRELLSFELNWISRVFGPPKDLHAWSHQALDIGVHTPDTYGIQLRFDQFTAVLLIDVVSRFGTRSLTVNFEKGQVRWHWEEKAVHLYSADTKVWSVHTIETDRSEPGYNENIVEGVYVNEMRAFLDALAKKSEFPSHLEDDIQNLILMSKLNEIPGREALHP